MGVFFTVSEKNDFCVTEKVYELMQSSFSNEFCYFSGAPGVRLPP